MAPPAVPAAEPAFTCLQVDGFLPASSKLLLLQGAMAGANFASRMSMLVPRANMLEDMCRSFQQRDGFAADISGGLDVRFTGGLQQIGKLGAAWANCSAEQEAWVQSALQVWAGLAASGCAVWH